MRSSPLCRFAIVGNEQAGLRARVAKLAPSALIVKKSPDAVISFGGDGTILKSERLFPGVPKLCVRGCDSCSHCNRGKGQACSGRWFCMRCFGSVLRRAVGGDYEIREEEKLEAAAAGKKKRYEKTALNEFQLHNADPTEAIRFSVFSNGKAFAENSIADGVVVCTSYGSSGYFHSITGKKFPKGAGVALNNPTVRIKPLVIRSGLGKLRVFCRLLRGRALFIADNDPEMLGMEAGDSFEVRLSKGAARFIV